MPLPNNLAKTQPLYEELLAKLNVKIAHEEFSEFIEPDHEVRKQLLIQVNAFLINFTQDFFRLMNMSVLAGEYVSLSNDEDLKNDLEQQTESFTAEVLALFVDYFSDEYHLAREICHNVE